MTLKEYINEVTSDKIYNITPSSVMYYLNGDEDGYEIEDFEITKSNLIIEDDMVIPLDIQGEVVNGIFECEYKRDIIGLEFWF